MTRAIIRQKGSINANNDKCVGHGRVSHHGNDADEEPQCNAAKQRVFASFIRIPCIGQELTQKQEKCAQSQQASFDDDFEILRVDESPSGYPPANEDNNSAYDAQGYDQIDFVDEKAEKSGDCKKCDKQAKSKGVLLLEGSEHFVFYVVELG